MLNVTVCYVCCLCSKIPMRCHWCCCFRYIRISSLFFSFGSFGLNLYIILYILRSLWVQEHTNVVSLCLFLNFVRQVVCSFVLFMCFHSLLLMCRTAEGKRRSFTALWGFGVWGGRFLWHALLTLPQTSLFYSEGDDKIHERLPGMKVLNLPTPLLFLVPSVLYPHDFWC